MLLELLSLMVLSSGTARIALDAPMLNALLRKVSRQGLEIAPTVTLRNLEITAITPRGLEGRLDVYFRGSVPLPMKRISFLPSRISWDFRLPVDFGCRLEVRGSHIVVPISGLSFKMGNAPRVSLAVFEAFQRWWNWFARTHHVLAFRTFDLTRVFSRHFGPGRWTFSIHFEKDHMILVATKQ